MPAPNYAQQGFIARSIASVRRILDGNISDITGPRFDRDQSQFVAAPLVGEMGLASEGSLLVASMTPSQTALQLGISATYSATAAALVIKNNATPTGAPQARTHLREIHFLCAVPPTSGTGLLYATILDNANRVPTTISGVAATGTAVLQALASSNMDESPPINTQVWFPNSVAGGAPPVVPSQGGGARVIVGNGNLRSVIPVGAASSGVQDDYRIVFGATDRATGASLRSSAGAAQIIEPHPAVTLGPQEFFLLYLWCPSNITAGFAFAGLDVTVSER